MGNSKTAHGLLFVLCLTALRTAAFADGETCSVSGLPLSRQLRQTFLDLLGRPPTLDEYRAVQAKGSFGSDDVRELMGRDEFYTKMKGYHRALLRSNITNSIYTEGDTRLRAQTLGLAPIGTAGNASAALRGANGATCDAFIEQDNCNAQKQDPLLEPATKSCRDSLGVPMPVSVDYNAQNYACQAFAPDVTDCAAAIGKSDVTGRAYDTRHAFYCDMRRGTDGSLKPFFCLPDVGKPQTAALTLEELDSDGRITAFVNPAATGNALARLNRCTIALTTGPVKGAYSVQAGCIQREGVVQAAAPYFDTSGASTVAMCAIEAQARDVNPYTLQTCESVRFSGDRACGCGVNSRRCDQGTGTLFAQRIAAINEEPLQIIDSVLRRDEDYFTILTTRRSFINGVLSQTFREQQNATVWLVTSPASREATPNVPITTTSWAEYTRDSQASGVLTTPAWLYRFPTQRSRVNQFYNAFLCKHFSPPAGADAPSPEDACNRENNLAKRCGCSYCHATIEPTGAHWGRFGERNAQYLDPAKFPKFDARCRDCALAGDTTCNNECGNYVMQAYDGDGASSLGQLRTYLYRTPDEEPNIAGGPKALVERMLQTGDLERCTVTTMWNELLGRPMTALEESMYLKTLTERFTAKNHNLKELILEVVSTQAYRRID